MFVKKSKHSSKRSQRLLSLHVPSGINFIRNFQNTSSHQEWFTDGMWRQNLKTIITHRHANFTVVMVTLMDCFLVIANILADFDVIDGKAQKIRVKYRDEMAHIACDCLARNNSKKMVSHFYKETVALRRLG